MKGGRGSSFKAAAIRFWCPNKAQVGVPGLFICRFSFFRCTGGLARLRFKAPDKTF